VFTEETTNVNFIVSGLTRPEFEPTIYRICGKPPIDYIRLYVSRLFIVSHMKHSKLEDKK